MLYVMMTRPSAEKRWPGRYMIIIRNSTETKGGVDRVVLPDFEVLRYIGISSFLNDLRYPDFVRQNLIERIRIERPQLYEQLNQQHEYFMQEMEKQEGSQQ